MTHIVLQTHFILGLLLVVGYFAGKAANFFRLPRISGYIFAGLALSPSITGVLSYQQINEFFTFTSESALAFISYSIGGSLQLSRLRGLGVKILWINLSEGVGAFICTCLAVYAAGSLFPPFLQEETNIFLSVILIFGGISVATAPAATMAVIHELRARGPLTTTLLGVVALDDALSIMIFSICLAVASQLLVGVADIMIIWRSFAKICAAFIIGIAGGYLFSLFFDPSKRPEINFMLSLGAIFLVGGLSLSIGLSPVLTNMVMGFVVINKVKGADDLFHQLDIIEDVVFCLFFTLAAAHFDITVFGTSLLLGVILLLGRFGGKLGGTYIGGKLSKAPFEIYSLLGFTLLPQAGLSLGLIFLAQPFLLPEIFDIMLSAMLVSIILNEIISPPLVKWSITRAGEHNPG